jgi:hypothetical protein
MAKATGNGKAGKGKAGKGKAGKGPEIVGEPGWPGADFAHGCSPRQG